jgi:hypothetical protein
MQQRGAARLALTRALGFTRKHASGRVGAGARMRGKASARLAKPVNPKRACAAMASTPRGRC